MIIYCVSYYYERTTDGIVELLPKILVDLGNAGLFTSGSGFRDATDDAPNPLTDPNIMVARLEIEQNAFAWILSSNDYGVGSILYDLPNPYSPDDKPSANEHGKRRSYFAKLGVSQAEFENMFGTPGNPHKRKQGADNCIAWIKTLKIKTSIWQKIRAYLGV